MIVSRWLRLSLCSWLLMLAGCGKSSSTAEAAGGGGGGGSGGGGAGDAAAGSPQAGSSNGGSSAGDGGERAGDDTGGALMAGAGGKVEGGAGGMGGASGAAEDEPSRQTVTFEVTNGAAERRVIALEGVGCTPFMVLAITLAAPVWTSAATNCGPCQQCPRPPVGTSRVAELAAGQSLELVWDARRVTLSQQTALCSGVPTPYTRAIAAPVPAGKYRVKVAVFAGLPTGCGVDGRCDPPVTTTQEALPYASLCDANAQAEVEFELPIDGDLTVPITIE